MPRFEIKDSHILVAYGNDHAVGVFLSVSDDRIEYQEGASDEVNDVAESIGVKDDGGVYLDLHTGPLSIGKKVSPNCMRVYLSRYGVSENQINELLNDPYDNLRDEQEFKKNQMKTKKEVAKSSINDENNNELELSQSFQKLGTEQVKNTKNDCNIKKALCSVCSKATTQSCAKCKVVYYCSKTCQVSDWPVHKFICGSLPFPKKKNTNSVYGMLFPENGDKIEIIEIPRETNFVKDDYKDDDDDYEDYEDEDTSFVSLQLKPIFDGENPSCSYMQYNPLRNKKMDDCLFIEYKDAFFEDGSKSNKIVQKITQNKNPHDWRGPILITKQIGVDIESYPDYIDIEAKDLSNIIDYFVWYGSN